MRRRDQAGGKAVKTPRRKALKRRNAPAIARRRKPSALDATGSIALLTRERDEALEQQTATSEVLKVISASSGELAPVFDAILANATRICEAAFGNLFLREGFIFRSVAVHSKKGHADSWRRNPVADVRDNPGNPIDRLFKTKKVIHVPDLRIDQSYIRKNDRVVTLVEVGGARTHLSVPMLKDGELIGSISMYRQEVRPFTDKQIELVQNFADQAVIAIENARLLNELRHRTDDLSEALEQQTATSEVLKVISSSPGELEPVFNAMLKNAVRICDAKFGHLWLREGDALRVGATHGAPEVFAAYLREQPVFHPKPQTGLGQLLRTKQLFQLEDISAVPTYGDELREATINLAGARSLIGVPMARDEEVIGAIVIYRQEVRPFTDKQIELVQNFAAQAVIAIENTRLLSELRESLQQQTATADVLKVISSSPGDLEPVFNTMLANATRICEAKIGILFRYEDGAYTAMATLGVTPAYAEYLNRGAIRPGPTTGLGRVASSKQPAHIIDTQAEGAYADREPLRVATAELGGARTLLNVPMLKEGVLVGAIGIYRQEVRPFTDKQIEFVTNFAAQAVIAIENARLLSELRESLQQQTATADVLKVISSSSGELAPVFVTILDKALDLCEAAFGFATTYDGERFELAAQRGVPDALAAYFSAGMDQPRPGDAHWRLRAGEELIHFLDQKDDDAYRLGNPLRRAVVDLGGVRTALVVALRKDNTLLGGLTIYRKEVRPFSEKQVAILQNFAAQAVIAIENAQLLNELRQRTDDLSESLQQQTATADVLKVISRSTFDLKMVLDTLVKSAARLCRADKANVALLRGNTVEYVAQDGFPPGFLEYMQSLRLTVQRGSIGGRAVLEAKIIHIPDVLADSEFVLLDAQKIGSFRTALGVPLMREGIPIGTMFLSRSAVEPFSQQQIELVSTFADQAVIAIENVRLFESVEARTRELAASLENLRNTQDRLVQTQKLASLGQLTAGIAHEIKNPLNFINNFSGVSVELIGELREALKDVSLNEKRRSEIAELMDTLRGNLDKVVQHGKRADSIVKNMLLHSREGSGEHRPVDINVLVEEGLNLAYHGARAEKRGFNIKLEKSFDPNAGEADVFPQDITRVLLNLISNGFHAATQRELETNGGDYEPTLVAATKNCGDRVEITIRDNGMGIPADVKEKMFNPFFTTKPAGEGTGLGLSISHDIVVKQHGGSIEVETQPGEYTEIKIVLPRAAVFPQ